MAKRTLLTLAEISFQLRLIDISEYEERVEVAYWLSEENPSFIDPRGLDNKEDGDLEKGSDDRTVGEAVNIIGSGKALDPNWLELIVLGKWYFTLSDDDPYPSVPHGHMQSENRPWPKLNPYTGRAFKAKHQEEPSLSLSKHEMRNMWRDEKFRSYCRSHVLRYMETYPYFTFGVRDPLRFPLW